MNDTSQLEIFNESNIIIEEIQGMILDSVGIYRQNTQEDVTDLMLQVQEFDDMNDLLYSYVENPDIITHEATLDEKVSAMAVTVRQLDEFGHALIKKKVCPVCGKEVDIIAPNGYCSVKCFASDFLSRITLNSKSGYSDEVETLINKIQDILNLLSITLNTIAKLPDLLANIPRIPVEYREYVTVRINIGFVNLKILTNKLLIRKNEILIKLFKRVKFGVIDEKLQPLFDSVQKIIQVVQQLKIAMDQACESIIKLLQNPLYGIQPQSYGFFMTPKSFMFPLTSGKFLIQIPFDSTHPTTLGFPTQFPAGYGASCMNNINYELIDKIIQSIFLPITEVEYLLDPEVFKVRLALSDQNMPTIKNVIQTLETLCVMGGDYLPRYQRLNLKNIWFIIAILAGWAPVSKEIFGDYCIHPFI